jgi:hypothetical protein
MPRGREDLPRQFPAVQFQVVCNAMTAAGLPPDASLSQVMSLIDFVLCNPTVFDHWLRARHPRRHLGERSGNRAWESFTARCFLTWSNWRALDGPPLQVDVVVGCLDRIAGLVGMDRFPEGFSSVASVLPPTPPVITAFESIRVPLLLVPEDIECAEPACGRRRLHLATDATHATSSFALRNGLALFCQAVTSECPNCARRYTVDGSSTLDPLSGSRSHAYTNEAPFLRVGDNLYVDRHFAATQDAAIYRFHANFGSFANFVSDALGSSSPTARERYRFTQRQSKALFVQASLRRIAASVGQTFHSQSDLDSGRLAAAAYEALANPTPGVHVQLGGYFPAGRSHSCNTCHLPAMAAAPAVVQMVPGVGQNGVGLEGNPVAAPVQGQEVSCAAIDGLVVGPYVRSCTSYGDALTVLFRGARTHTRSDKAIKDAFGAARIRPQTFGSLHCAGLTWLSMATSAMSSIATLLYFLRRAPAQPTNTFGTTGSMLSAAKLARWQPSPDESCGFVSSRVLPGFSPW